MQTTYMDSTSPTSSQITYVAQRAPLTALNTNDQLRNNENVNNYPLRTPKTENKPIISENPANQVISTKRTNKVFIQSNRNVAKSPIRTSTTQRRGHITDNGPENPKISRINKSVNKNSTSNLGLKHNVRVSRIIKRPSQRVITRKSVSPFKQSHLKIIQKSVKKLILEPQTLNESEMEKVRRMSRPRSVNEKLKKIVVNQCSIIKSKQMPTGVYQKLIQDAEIRDKYSQSGPASKDSLLREENVNLAHLAESSQRAVESEAFQESLVHEIMKKSIFSNQNSAKKPNADRKLENDFEPAGEFNFDTSDQRERPVQNAQLVLGQAIPSQDLSASEVKRLRLSARSKTSCRSRNSSCYKIVKKELEVSARMSHKQKGRLNHDLRAFQVRAEQVSPRHLEDEVQVTQLAESLLKTMPAAPVDHNPHNYFYSPSKSNREMNETGNTNHFVELSSRSNSIKRNERIEPYHTKQAELDIIHHNLFDEPETPKEHEMQVSPELLNFDDAPLRESKKFRTAVARVTEDDPVLLINQLESDIEQLKNLKKRTASHTPTRNQRMIYRQILDNIRPAKKKFKTRNKSAIKNTQKRSSKTGAKLRKNYSKKIADKSSKPRKNAWRGDAKQKGLSKYCSMKYAALQLKNQQNMLEDLLESCQNKFRRLDRNITELENKREIDFERNRKTIDPGRDSKYYSNFTVERGPKKSRAKGSNRGRNGTRRTTGKPRGIPSKLKINQIFRDLTKSINPKTPKTTGIPRGKYKKKKATF